MRKKNKVRTEKEIREEYLKKTKTDIKIETKYIIEFEDHEQDFLKFFIDEKGRVLDSQPCQRWMWVGRFTVPNFCKKGDLLPIYLDKETYIKYPIKKIKIKK